MSKRTRSPRAPFPWKVYRKGSGRYTVVDANDRGIITTSQVAQSNAWLIASAPDLLAACKAAMAYLEDTDIVFGPLYEDLYRDFTTFEKSVQTNGKSQRVEKIWLSPRTVDVARLPLFEAIA